MAYHKAYGKRHQQRRARLMQQLPMSCGICGRVMTRAMALHLHHSKPGSKERGLPGDVLTHAACNEGAGAPGVPRPRADAPRRDITHMRNDLEAPAPVSRLVCGGGQPVSVHVEAGGSRCTCGGMIVISGRAW